MKVKKIGFGYVKNLGNCENCKLYMEAELEDWEDPSESLNLLRGQIAIELSLPDKWFDLKGKFNRTLQTLENINAAITAAEKKLERAERAWENFSEFLTAHGVDPETLTIENFSAIAMRKLHTGIPRQENTIGYSPKDATNENTENIKSGFYYEPYEGDDSDDSESHEDYEYEENPNNDRIPF